MTRLEEYESHFVYTVDCRTGTTSRKFAPIPVPQDRREDLPSLREAEADER